MPRRAEPQPTAEPKPVPPIGVKVSTDMERRSYGIRARARWTDPTTKRRVTRSEIVRDEAAAHAFFDQLRNASVARKGPDVVTMYGAAQAFSFKNALFPLQDALAPGSPSRPYLLGVVEQLAAQISIQNIKTPKMPKLEILN